MFGMWKKEDTSERDGIKVARIIASCNIIGGQMTVAYRCVLNYEKKHGKKHPYLCETLWGIFWFHHSELVRKA